MEDSAKVIKVLFVQVLNVSTAIRDLKYDFNHLIRFQAPLGDTHSRDQSKIPESLCHFLNSFFCRWDFGESASKSREPLLFPEEIAEEPEIILSGLILWGSYEADQCGKMYKVLIRDALTIMESCAFQA